jgi:hypothetical protein
MSTIIYKDDTAGAIFVQDANGVQFLNSLQAFMVNPSDVVLSVLDVSKGIEIFSGIGFGDFVDASNVIYGANATEVTNALNALFQGTGGTGDIPVITSSLSINAVEGVNINYELTVTNGVAYEWTNLPTGLTVVNGHERLLIGNIAASGTYTPTIKAINYFGSDTETLTITVANPPFANTKSIRFANNDYLSGNATLIDATLGRAGNGSGASDAWTVSMYFKAGTHTGGAKQTLFYYGGNDYNNEGHIWIYYKGNEQAVYLEYGSKNNYIRLKSTTNVLTQGVWSSLIFTYDGGTTGNSSGSVVAYYSRFDMWVDGALVTTTDSNNNYGWSNEIKDDVFYIGRRATANDYMKDFCKVDELAMWDSDQTTNVSTIYNSGIPSDLSLLGTPPNHWWRMGDGDTFPTLIDTEGSAPLTMYNMTVGDIVNDVP